MIITWYGNVGHGSKLEYEKTHTHTQFVKYWVSPWQIMFSHNCNVHSSASSPSNKNKNTLAERWLSEATSDSKVFVSEI